MRKGISESPSSEGTQLGSAHNFFFHPDSDYAGEMRDALLCVLECSDDPLCTLFTLLPSLKLSANISYVAIFNAAN